MVGRVSTNTVHCTPYTQHHLTPSNPSNPVKVEGLVLERGFDEAKGGAINAVEATLGLSDCILRDNTVAGTLSTGAVTGVGGAVFADYSDIEVDNTAFERNTVTLSHSSPPPPPPLPPPSPSPSTTNTKQRHRHHQHCRYPKGQGQRRSAYTSDVKRRHERFQLHVE